MQQPTETQIGLLHHTLGLSEHHCEPWRNHFVASENHHDILDLRALESSGLMKQVRNPGFLRDDDITFVVTEAGKQLAIEKLPELPDPKKMSNYQRYQHSEYSDSFVDFLGITLPELEYSHNWKTRGYMRYVRTRWVQGDREVIAGEYMPTRKEAKASYKEALRAHRLEQKNSVSYQIDQKLKRLDRLCQ